jgi:HAE1 family hydrophobic/amphiphilic exporter-1
MPVRTLVVWLLAASCASAQLNPFPLPSYFRNTFGRTIPKIELRAPVRLNESVSDGSLRLSIKSYLELVMANNTDIAIQMLSVETARNAITRAYGIWDPQAQASFSDQKSTTPSTGALAGASTLVALSQPANFSYSQTLPTGTQYSVSFSAAKSTTNSSFSTLNPALSSSLAVSVSQPLIKNRGTYVNHLNLMVARSRYRVSDYNLRASLLQMINTAENAYWDVVQAHENLHVQESARKLAKDSLDLSQKQLDLGAISPLDIYNPQQQLATAELSVSQAKFQVEQTENVLRKEIGADLDPDVRDLPIELTETVDLPVDSIVYSADTEIAKALAGRPEVKAALQSLDVDDLGLASSKNELLPDLSLSAQYMSQGVGGIFYQRTNVFDNSGASSQIVTAVPGGFGDALGQMFGFGYPVYSLGLTLRLPVKSHAAEADMADAIVSKRRDALTLRTTQQQVRLDILTAMNALNSAKASVQLAIVAQDFARKNLDAENQKYQLGNEQVQFVLQAQNTLVQAQSALVTNQVGMRRSILNLLTRTGELLDERGIVIR